MKSTETLSGAR